MELFVSDEKNSVRERKNIPRTRDQATECDISIPGLNRLSNESRGKSAKIIWLLSMLTCAGFCIYFTADRLQNYFEFPTTPKSHFERRQQIQFPPMTFCLQNSQCYYKMACSALQRQTPLASNDTSCDMDAPLDEFNISLSQIWKNCRFISVDVIVESGQKKNCPDFVVTHRASALGYCATVTHTKQVPFISLITSMKISLKSQDANLLIFIPHKEPAININGYELFNHNVESIEVGSKVFLKIHEELSLQENVTGRECYDSESESERMHKHSLNFTDQSICRLPFLPEKFPECRTLNDVRQSTLKILDKFNSTQDDVTLTPRNVCNETMYAIVIDFVVPNESTDFEKVTTTEILIRFVDSTRTVASEYLSYTFPALISDLFAYWGFFLCLSAPVFLEIFEFAVITTYRFFARNSVQVEA